MNKHRSTPHPLVLLLLPFPAISWLLVTPDPKIPIIMIHICVLAASFLGPKIALKAYGGTITVLLFIFLSFWFWLGTLAAIMLALRMSALVMMFYTTFQAIRWPVLVDTLISQFRVPYPLVDALTMTGRFTALMRNEYRLMRVQLRVNTRGKLIPQLLAIHTLVIPLLVASFRHADTTALALENRKFASSKTRTTHYQQRLTVLDWAFVITGWAILINLPKLIAML